MSNDFREILSTFGCCLLMLLAYILIWICYEQVFHSTVIFYSGLRIMGVMFFVSIVIFLAIKKFSKIYISLKIYCYSMAYFLLTAFLFNITFPTIADRSLSVYIIAAVHNNNGTIKTSDLYHKSFQKMSSSPETKKRINEQLELKNFTVKDDTVSLTESGRRLYTLYRVIGKCFNANRANYDPGHTEGEQ